MYFVLTHLYMYMYILSVGISTVADSINPVAMAHVRLHEFFNSMNSCCTHVHMYMYMLMYKQTYLVHVHNMHICSRKDDNMQNVSAQKLQPTTKRFLVFCVVECF